MEREKTISTNLRQLVGQLVVLGLLGFCSTAVILVVFLGLAAFLAAELAQSSACAADLSGLGSLGAKAVLALLVFAASAGLFVRWLSRNRADAFLKHFLLFGNFLFALSLGLFCTVVVPQYVEVFAAFGVDLPAPTQFVLGLGRLSWLPLLAAVLLWWCSRRRVVHTFWLVTLWSVQLCLPALAVATMYLPIFILGCPV